MSYASEARDYYDRPEKEEDVREGSIQSDLNYLENRVGALLSTVQEVERRTRVIRVVRPQVDDSNVKAIQEKSPIAQIIVKQTDDIQKAIEILETILCELTI